MTGQFSIYRPDVTPSVRVSGPVVVRVSGLHDIVATTVLTLANGAVCAARHLGSADGRHVTMGWLADDSDTTLIAWSPPAAAEDPAMTFAVEQHGGVLATVRQRQYAAANVPATIIGVRNAYVVRLRVRGGELRLMTPPTGAIVTVESIGAWMAMS